MRNIIFYYSAILVPIPLLFWVAKTGDSMWFTILLFIYAFPYRTLIDGLRLVNKKLIRWNEIWKLSIPWKRRRYFKDLYFTR